MDSFNDSAPLLSSSLLLEAVEFERSLQQLKHFHDVSEVLTPLVIGCFLFVGLFGNIIVIYVTMTTNRVIKHPMHSMLVLNLAVADIIYLLSSAPYHAITYSVPGWIYGPFLCPALHYLSIQTMAVSVFTMCSLAIMRFIALMMPFRIQRSVITTSAKLSGSLIIVIVWIAAGGLAAPNLIYFGLLDYPGRNPNVTSSSNNTVQPQAGLSVECVWRNMETDKSYSIALFVITFVIPLLLVTFLYLLIAREIHFFMRKNKPILNRNDRQEEDKEYVKATIMVLCLIIAFLFCWFPRHLYVLILISQNYSAPSYALMRSILELLGSCISYAHGCVNPFIYTLAAPGFKQSLRQSMRNKDKNTPGSKKKSRRYSYERGKQSTSENLSRLGQTTT